MASAVAEVLAGKRTLLVECDCDTPGALDGLPNADGPGLLTPDEAAAMGRWPNPSSRQRALVRRAALRQLLGAGLSTMPAQVPLWHDPSGRPRVGAPGQRDLLGLSCSSHGAAAVFCLTPGRAVGVDLEAWTACRFAPHLAAHILHKHELKTFESLPQPLGLRWLAGLWACKEAWLKAAGTGLALDPRELELCCPRGASFDRSGSFFAQCGAADFGGQGMLRWEAQRVMALVLPVQAPSVDRLRLLISPA